MNPDPASLDNLRDIVVPPAVSWWPLAPGWYVVILASLILAGAWGWRTWRRWKENAYRREALAALRETVSPEEIAELLKRAALSVFPRAEVAGLTGDAWCDWLEQTGPGPMSPESRAALRRCAFEPGASGNQALRSFAMSWMKFHQARAEKAGKEDAAC